MSSSSERPWIQKLDGYCRELNAETSDVLTAQEERGGYFDVKKSVKSNQDRTWSKTRRFGGSVFGGYGDDSQFLSNAVKAF